MIKISTLFFRTTFLIIVFMTGLTFLPGCSDDGDGGLPPGNQENPAQAPDDKKVSIDPGAIDVSEADYCDILQPTKCLCPFPNDYFMIPDPGTDTGLRVNLDPLAMPINKRGKEIDPAEWNRNDGFSPGAMIVTHVPGVDTDETGGA